MVQVKGGKGSVPSVARGIMKGACKSYKKRLCWKGKMNWKNFLIYLLSEAGMKKLTLVGN